MRPRDEYDNDCANSISAILVSGRSAVVCGAYNLTRFRSADRFVSGVMVTAIGEIVGIQYTTLTTNDLHLSVTVYHSPHPGLTHRIHEFTRAFYLALGGDPAAADKHAPLHPKQESALPHQVDISSAVDAPADDIVTIEVDGDHRFQLADGTLTHNCFFTSRELGISYTLRRSVAPSREQECLRRSFLYRTMAESLCSLAAHRLPLFSSRHFFWSQNNLWREDFERIGMEGRMLEASLVAEREQCVASLPYEELLQERERMEREEEWRRTIHEEAPQGGRHATSGGPRAKSDGTLLLDHADTAPRSNHSSIVESNASSSGSSKTMPLEYSRVVSIGKAKSETPLAPPVSLGARVHVFLSANDDITPTDSIRRYLQQARDIEEAKWGRGKAMVEYHIFADVGHAEPLFHPHMRRQIIDRIQQLPSDAEFKRESDLELSARTSHAQTPS